MNEVNSNSKQKQQIKFPVAVVFAIIFALFQLVLSLLFLNWARYITGGYTALFLQIITFLLFAFLIVVLFVRENKGLLVTALGLLCFVPISGFGQIMTYTFSYLYYDSEMWDFFLSLSGLATIATYLAELGSMLLVFIFAIAAFKKDTNAAKVCRKIWFLSGILSFCYFAGYTIFCRGVQSILTSVQLAIGEVPMMFLLGWWLTHPYKKEKPQYYAGQNMYAPYGGYQAGNIPGGTAFGQGVQPGMQQEMQPLFCPGCGKRLSPNEQFCAACGRKRPESAQPVEQPQQAQQGYYQQPVYSQDIPTSGMNALGFFLPGVGLILYLIWKDQTPMKARSIGKFALIGFIVWMSVIVLLSILSYVIPMIILFG